MVGKAASLQALDPISPITHDLTNPTLPRSIDVAGAGNAARTERHERRGERGGSHEQLVRDRDRGGVPAARVAAGSGGRCTGRAGACGNRADAVAPGPASDTGELEVAGAAATELYLPSRARLPHRRLLADRRASSRPEASGRLRLEHSLWKRPFCSSPSRR